MFIFSKNTNTVTPSFHFPHQRTIHWGPIFLKSLLNPIFPQANKASVSFSPSCKLTPLPKTLSFPNNFIFPFLTAIYPMPL